MAIDAPLPTTPYVRQTRIIRATRQACYDAWTKPEIFKTWWGPHDRLCTVAELNVRVGGAMLLTLESLPGAVMVPGVPPSFTSHGVYTEVVPLERLQFTLKANWNKGEPSVVTVTFGDVEGGTEMTVLHEKLPSEAVHQFAGGWVQVLDKFTARVAA